MTLSDLASIGSLVSGVAVLVSLALLVLQSRYMIRNQQSLVHLARTQLMRDNLDSISSAEMAEIALKGNRGDVLTPTEHLRYTNWTWSMIVAYENNFLQHRAGSLNDEQFEATLGSLKWNCLMPGFRAFWVQSRVVFEKNFALFMDRLMADYPAVRDPTALAFEIWKQQAAKEVEAALPDYAQLPLAF